MKSVIEMVYEKYEDAETPRSFFYWATIAAISAAVGRNVYLNKKVYTLFPNLYVMLVADSGLGKGAATALCRNLVAPLEVSKVIDGSGSIEAIVRDLGEQISLESGKVLKDANGIIIANELAAAFVASPQTQLTLTDLYDSIYKVNHNVRLKKGNHYLKNLAVSMCSATNEENLDVFLDANSISGGFVARTLIIKETEKYKINPLIDHDQEKVMGIDLSEIIPRMKDIAKVQGNFTLTDSAKSLFKEWHAELNKKIKKIEDITGTKQRIHDHALKVAMCLSLAERLDRVMTEEHLWEAIQSVWGRLKDVRDITVGTGKSEIAKGTKIVLQQLYKAEGFTMWRRDLLRECYRHLDANELDRVVDTLEQAHMIVVERSTAGIRLKIDPSKVAEIGQLLKRMSES